MELCFSPQTAFHHNEKQVAYHIQIANYSHAFSPGFSITKSSAPGLAGKFHMAKSQRFSTQLGIPEADPKAMSNAKTIC